MTRYRAILPTLLAILIISGTTSRGTTAYAGKNATGDTMTADTVAADSADMTYADTTAADSLLPDSLAADSLPLTKAESLMRLLDNKMFGTSQVAVMAYDLTADTLIFAHNERQLMRPASTMKLLTAITALHNLGSSYRLATSLIADGNTATQNSGQQQNIFIGDIIVRGGMDPLFNTDDMHAFVDAIAQQHIDTIYGDIRADRSFKDTLLLGEGWCWDDDNPVLTPLPWNRKDTFVRKYRQMLQAQGITILPTSLIPTDSLGNPTVTTPPARRRTLCTRTHTIQQILIPMLKKSDNLYAEALFYHIAAQRRRPATRRHTADIMRRLIASLGLNPAHYRIADGSGLSLYNYQTAELQVKLLRFAYHSPDIYPHLYPALPVAGTDGTLKKRMRTQPTLDNVHAKTGSLTGISSLSGYLTSADGNTIAFAIINQGIMSATSAKRFQDNVCRILCR